MRVRSVGYTGDVANWYARLLSDPYFFAEVLERYRKLRAPGGAWSDSMIQSYISNGKSQPGKFLSNNLIASSFALCSEVFERWALLCCSAGLEAAVARDMQKWRKGNTAGLWDFEAGNLQTWFTLLTNFLMFEAIYLNAFKARCTFAMDGQPAE